MPLRTLVNTAIWSMSDGAFQTKNKKELAFLFYMCSKDVLVQPPLALQTHLGAGWPGSAQRRADQQVRPTTMNAPRQHRRLVVPTPPSAGPVQRHRYQDVCVIQDRPRPAGICHTCANDTARTQQSVVFQVDEQASRRPFEGRQRVSAGDRRQHRHRSIVEREIVTARRAQQRPPLPTPNDTLAVATRRWQKGVGQECTHGPQLNDTTL